jgi:hypothetical protein
MELSPTTFARMQKTKIGKYLFIHRSFSSKMK